MESYYEFLKERKSWEDFLLKEETREYKDERLIRQLKRVLKNEDYLKIDKDFLLNYALPRKVLLGEHNTSKKRIVYVYRGIYMLILKLTSFYMLKHYNHLFVENSLAYTEGRSVKSAFRLLREYNLTREDVVYKTDFSDYFNSIDLDLLDPILKGFLKNEELHTFIMSLLREKKVKYRKGVYRNSKTITLIEEVKGVMAGSPIAGILANIYMHEVDKLMYEHSYKYIRYADDVLVVGEDAYTFFLKEISKLKIIVNPKKTQVLNIDTGITFLGFYYKGNTIDIAEKSFKKMKSRFKRRSKWYSFWMKDKGIDREVAVKDYIRKINEKLFSDTDDSINWSRWYLPNINTTKTLKALDDYFIICIKALYNNSWSKTSKTHYPYNKKLKELGYRSLVEEYYNLKKESIRIKVE